MRKPAARAKEPTVCRRTVIWLARNWPGVVKSFLLAALMAIMASGSVSRYNKPA